MGYTGPGPTTGRPSSVMPSCKTAGLLKLAAIGETKAKNDSNKFVVVVPAEGHIGDGTFRGDIANERNSKLRSRRRAATMEKREYNGIEEEEEKMSLPHACAAGELTRLFSSATQNRQGCVNKSVLASTCSVHSGIAPFNSTEFAV